MGPIRKVYPLLAILWAATCVSCYCPLNERLGPCSFRVHCRATIRDVTLPLSCQGSTNYPVSVDLTLTEAVERFDDQNADFEFLTSITTLKISGDWPTTNLSLLYYTPRLENLHLTGNNIEVISGYPFFILNRLETIDLSYNRLKDVEELFQFENSPSPNKMRKLYLANNLISDIPGDAFGELKFLVELDLSHNNISDLTEEPFNSLSNLQTLKLNNNRIKDINGAVNNLHSLKHLFLSGNLLQNIDAPSLKIIYELETFDISQNQLESLTPVIFLRHWSHFESNTVCKITLSGNQIVYISNATSSKNLLERFARSPRRKYNTVDVLTELDLSQNQISHIEYDAFQTVVGLSVLDLSQNKLLTFDVNPKDLQHVKYLNLSTNHLQQLDFDAFCSMVNLQNLDLSFNYLDNIPDLALSQTYNLKYLNMTFNEIRILKNLRVKVFHADGGVLDLSNNGLYKLNIPSGEGLYLKTLLLNANNISDVSLIDLYHQNELRTLNMNQNLIQELDMNSLKLPGTLTYLELSCNRIDKIGPGSFHRIAHLYTLRLGHNNISTIEYGAFQGLGALVNLDLSFNNIKSIDSKVLMDLKSLTILSLRNNGLYVLEYKAWLGHKFDLKVYLEGNNFTCEWLGTALNDFNNGYSRMRPTAISVAATGSGYSIEGIPCIKKGSEVMELKDATYSTVMADDRLLIITQKILEAVRDQNSLMRKFILGPKREELDKLIKI